MKKLKDTKVTMPELRMPDFLVDLYWDLRDRRLLPLVALVLVAILAVPFLLSGGSDKQPPPPAASAGAPSATGTSLAVVQSSSTGLRGDYRKRLGGHAPTDPFKQRYTVPESTEAASGSKGGGTEGSGSFVTHTTAGGGSTSTSTTTSETKAAPGPSGPTPTPAPKGGKPASGGGSGESGVAPGHLTLYSFAVDVRIVRTASGSEGEKEKATPTTREKVVPPTALPSEKTQVVTYMGISPKTRNPLFLVSDEVTGVFGEAKCLSGASTCQLLEVETGMPITFVYGPAGIRYKLTVLKVEPVVSGHS